MHVSALQVASRGELDPPPTVGAVSGGSSMARLIPLLNPTGKTAAALIVCSPEVFHQDVGRKRAEPMWQEHIVWNQKMHSGPDARLHGGQSLRKFSSKAVT